MAKVNGIGVEDVASIIQDAICEQRKEVFIPNTQRHMRVHPIIAGQSVLIEHHFVSANGYAIDCNYVARQVCEEVGLRIKRSM